MDIGALGLERRRQQPILHAHQGRMQVHGLDLTNHSNMSVVNDTELKTGSNLLEALQPFRMSKLRHLFKNVLLQELVLTQLLERSLDSVCGCPCIDGLLLRENNSNQTRLNEE